MGFFRSLYRFIASIFGLAEGATEMATDRLLTSSPDAIRAQFRKTRENSINDYNKMRDAVAELAQIRNEKSAEMKQLSADIARCTDLMAGSIKQYNSTKDEALRIIYSKYAEQKEKNEERIDILEEEIAQQSKLIESYKLKLLDMQKAIEALKQEENETVADIVSQRQIAELNDQLQGLSTSVDSKNLEAVRNARKKARAIGSLSQELSGADAKVQEAHLLSAARAGKYSVAFDEAVNSNQLVLEGAIVENTKTVVEQDTKVFSH